MKWKLRVQINLVLLLGALAVSYVSAGIVSGGKSVQSRTQDDHGNYAFNYDIVDPLGASNGRWETGDKWGNKKGAYTITDIDGRTRRVEYIADELGFRVVVKTNEPGTAASAPAAAVIASPYAGTEAYAPVKTVVPAAAYVAPVAYAAPIVKAPVYRTAPVYAAPVYKSVAPYAYASAPIVAKAAPIAYASPYAHRSVYGHGHGHGHYGYY